MLLLAGYCAAKRDPSQVGCTPERHLYRRHLCGIWLPRRRQFHAGDLAANSLGAVSAKPPDPIGAMNEMDAFGVALRGSREEVVLVPV
jgi:hypothetical protein